MALINCPECGKEISDTAKICVNCGFTIQKWLTQQAAQETKAAREEKAAQKHAAALEKAMAKNPDDPEAVLRRRKKWFIISGAVALAAVIAVVLILVLQPKEINTFGIKPGMTRDEIVATMEKSGFELAYEEDQYFYFTGKAYLYGNEASGIVIQPHSQQHISIAYSFTDPKSLEGPNSTYEQIRQNIRKQLGEPKETSSEEESLYWEYWEKNNKQYRLVNFDNCSFGLYIFVLNN